MLPNLHAEFQATDMRRHEALAAAERYRTAVGPASRATEQGTPGGLRRQIGAALIRVGRRLEGVHPSEPAGRLAAAGR